MIRPNVQFHCNILNDPFLFLEENNKVYGFTITVYEIAASIRSLWGHVTGLLLFLQVSVSLTELTIARLHRSTP